jgi:hypothetical protein
MAMCIYSLRYQAPARPGGRVSNAVPEPPEFTVPEIDVADAAPVFPVPSAPVLAVPLAPVAPVPSVPVLPVPDASDVPLTDPSARESVADVADPTVV